MTSSKILSQGDWVVVFPGDPVKGPEVYAKVKTAIFLVDKDYGCSMQGAGQADKSNMEVLIKEISESLEFRLGEGIDWTMQWCLPFFQIDL